MFMRHTAVFYKYTYTLGFSFEEPPGRSGQGPAKGPQFGSLSYEVCAGEGMEEPFVLVPAHIGDHRTGLSL